nr:hypothetical protein [Frondihabitans sucicola]
MITSGSNSHRFPVPSAASCGATTGPPESVHGPAGLELVATPTAEPPPVVAPSAPGVSDAA